jgi:hypothetical protein
MLIFKHNNLRKRQLNSSVSLSAMLFDTFMYERPMSLPLQIRFLTIQG